MELNNNTVCNGLSTLPDNIKPVDSAEVKLRAMEADRQRFIEQVRIKLSAKDKEMQVILNLNFQGNFPNILRADFFTRSYTICDLT